MPSLPGIRAEPGPKEREKILLQGSSLLPVPLLGSLLASMAVHPRPSPLLVPSAFINLLTKTGNSHSSWSEALTAGLTLPLWPVPESIAAKVRASLMWAVSKLRGPHRRSLIPSVPREDFSARGEDLP